MLLINRMIKIFKKEEEDLEEMKRHEKRINDFKEDLADDLYRLKLRKDQKISNIHIRTPKRNSKLFYLKNSTFI